MKEQGPNRRSIFVAVIGSKPVNYDTNGPTTSDCKPLKNRIECEVFRTHHKGPVFYESTALTAELRALRDKGRMPSPIG